MTQIRIAALADLKGQIPTAHYFGRPHSIDADLELTRVLLGSPEGLTLREHRAAQALQDWAFCEKRFRTISDTAYPARDCDDPTPAPGMTPDQERELIGRREVHRRSALEYATAIGDALLMARYQAPLPAPEQGTPKPAPVKTASDGATSFIHSTKARRDTLTPVIELAQTQCRNATDTAEVWGALLVMAEKKTAPLIGATEEGLQYLKGGTAEIFTRKSLGQRLAR